MGNSIGKNHKDIWFTMGEENIKTFSKNYPGFFRHESAYQFLKSMNDVHVIVMKRFKGAVPPGLDVVPISSHEILFTYRSKREMADYLAGLISGVAHYFKEEIKVEVKSQTKTETEIKLTFDKEIQYTKKYRLNLLFSFGLTKNVSVKTAIMNTCFIAILSFIISAGLLNSIILSAATFLISIFSTITFNRPQKLILKELNKLSD